jgi:hypothetical protein
MGVDLCVYGNHTILFKNKNVFEIADEIKTRLNNIKLCNKEFLLYYCLFSKYSNYYTYAEIDSMKGRNEWHFDTDELENEYREYGSITYYGFYGLEIDFSENNISFWDPHCRYNYWFEYGTRDNYVNEWRKYYKQIVTEFGGDKVIYYPDCGYPEAELDLEQPFEELEKNFKKDFDDNGDIIDKLETINWMDNYSIKDWLPNFIKLR